MPKFDPDRLRIAREQSRRSQSSLAVETDLTRGAIALYESGKNVPSANVLARLARVLEKPFDYFFIDDVQNSVQVRQAQVAQ